MSLFFFSCVYKLSIFAVLFINMENKKLTGHVALFSANIIFGINNPISRALMPEILSPFTLTFFRLAGGMLLFWMVSLFTKKEYVPAKDIFLLFLASFFALTLNQLPFFVGLSIAWFRSERFRSGELPECGTLTCGHCDACSVSTACLWVGVESWWVDRGLSTLLGPEGSVVFCNALLRTSD